MASPEVSFIGMLLAKIKESVVAFMGVEKSFSMSFLIPNFRKKELRKCNN